MDSIFAITIEGFKELQRAGISLDHLFMLECFHKGINIEKHVPDAKLAQWKSFLIRKGFIDTNTINSRGIELLKCMIEGKSFEQSEKAGKEAIKDDFDKWWEVYPRNDEFTYKGKVFSGSRALRGNKEKSKTKFYEILKNGKYTGADMIRSLQTELNKKKEASFKEGRNKLTYMSNSEAYLNNPEKYEAFMGVPQDTPRSEVFEV